MRFWFGADPFLVGTGAASISGLHEFAASPSMVHMKRTQTDLPVRSRSATASAIKPLAAPYALVVAVSLMSLASGQSVAPPCVKWSQASDPMFWTPDTVALADYGASVVTGRKLTGKHVSVHASGSSENLFVMPSDPTSSTAVSGAAYAPVGARCFTIKDPVDGEWYPYVEVFDTDGDGTPRWNRKLQPSMQSTATAGVPTEQAGADNGITSLVVFSALSRDGKRVVAGGEGPQTDSAVLRVYDSETGDLLAAQDFPNSKSTWAFDATADVSRVALQVGSRLFVYNTETGTIELDHAESPGQTVSISQDGRRVAMGGRVFLPDGQGGLDQFGRFVIFERDDQGVWSELRRVQVGIDTRVQELDLDATGGRLGFAVRFELPNQFDVQLYDVDAGQMMFVHKVANLSSALQILPTDVKLDDAGRTIAVSSWGDIDQLTPEVLILNDAGVRICEFNSRGSALAVDLTPSGDRFAAVATSKHQNLFTNKGDLYYGLVGPALIDYSGVPRAGRELRFHVNPQLLHGKQWVVAASEARLPVATARGLVIDPDQIVRTWHPATSLADGRITVPAGSAGRELHFQAFTIGQGPMVTSNAFTLRIVE